MSKRRAAALAGPAAPEAPEVSRPENIVGFVAAIHKTASDKEGQGLLTLCIPLTALPEASRCYHWVGEVLQVYIKRQPPQRPVGSRMEAA